MKNEVEKNEISQRFSIQLNKEFIQKKAKTSRSF
jgi:hypothetical protein